MGIEPIFYVCKTYVLPLNYSPSKKYTSGGTRTHNTRILSPMPLPIGLPKQILFFKKIISSLYD